ncbi:MAG: hypothetical protein HXX12_14405 [Geothrix sp.]|uniref:hypothetical protein n=1 Tax=Geothrix sp. TaxID=1962974 RepID=UPI0017E66248|nr:hypothetical protein [Geothrix sp.]NWJ42151.1 hypothetical protein [Geothrix sp.]WIL19886.1 MAG: hypothetical protein QOZ81_002419 [Geothrix sp.]
MARTAPGLAVWGLGLLLALGLPGSIWRQAAPPGFPMAAVGPALLAVGALALLAPLLAWRGGPGLASRRSLALLEAPPDLLWAGLLLALWPAAWGPPGLWGWLLAFLAASLPGEVRWLAQAMPSEHPFPEAWGRAAVNRVRGLVLLRLWGRWTAARLPVWLTATLVLERILGVPGLGTDWMTRIAVRDRAGLSCWVLALALLWALSQRLEKEMA